MGSLPCRASRSVTAWHETCGLGGRKPTCTTTCTAAGYYWQRAHAFILSPRISLLRLILLGLACDCAARWMAQHRSSGSGARCAALAFSLLASSVAHSSQASGGGARRRCLLPRHGLTTPGVQSSRVLQDEHNPLTFFLNSVKQSAVVAVVKCRARLTAIQQLCYSKWLCGSAN